MNNSLLKSASISGLILGAVSIVVFLLEYVLGIMPVGIAKPMIIMLVGIAITVIILVLLLKKYRAAIGGFISFKDAFLYCFIALLVATIVGGLFIYVFLQFFDPEYIKKIMEAQKGFMENYLAGKVSDEQITQTLEKIDEQAAKNTPGSQFVKSLWTGAIFDGILALIVGAVMKKNPATFEENKDGVI